MKILLVNLHSAHNAGDTVLLRTMLAELRRVFPQAEITLSMSDWRSYQGQERVLNAFTSWFKEMSYAQNRWRPAALLAAPWLILVALMAAISRRWLGRALILPLPVRHGELVRAYAEADLVISNPGGYLYSSGAVGLPFMLTVGSIAYALLTGKPTYTMPQTVGPIFRARDEWLLRRVLPRLRLCLLRDQDSVQVIERAHVRASRAIVVPDLAFLYSEDDDDGADRLTEALAIPRDGSAMLGVTVINWGAQNRRFLAQAAYEQAIADALRAWISLTGGTVVLFPQVCGPLAADDDRVPARRVAALLCDLSAHVRVVQEALPPALLRTLYGRMDLFFGTRLHSNIFALTTGTPVVAIAYQAKTFGTLRLFGLEGRVLRIEECAGDRATHLLLQGWRDRAILRTQVAQALPRVQSNARLAADLIARDAASLGST